MIKLYTIITNATSIQFGETFVTIQSLNNKTVIYYK